MTMPVPSTLAKWPGWNWARASRTFVGDPLRMMLVALEEDSRFPYVIELRRRGCGRAHTPVRCGRLAGWPDDESAWLLRGFLIDRRQQGRGLGPSPRPQPSREAAKLTARLGGGQSRRRAFRQ